MIAAGDDHRKRMMIDYPSSNYLFRGRVPGQLVSESVMVSQTLSIPLLRAT